MKEKVLLFGVVVSLLCLIGCYNTHIMTRSEIEAMPKEQVKAKVERRDLTVCTRDTMEYRFSEENFRVQGDTLVGFGVGIRRSGDPQMEWAFHGSLALTDIISLQTTEFSMPKTLLAIGLPVGAAVAFMVVMIATFSNK